MKKSNNEFMEIIEELIGELNDKSDVKINDNILNCISQFSFIIFSQIILYITCLIRPENIRSFFIPIIILSFTSFILLWFYCKRYKMYQYSYEASKYDIDIFFKYLHKLLDLYHDNKDEIRKLTKENEDLKRELDEIKKNSNSQTL